MLPLSERATGHESAYTERTRSTVSRSLSGTARWKVCLMRLITSTFPSASTSPTVSARRSLKEIWRAPSAPAKVPSSHPPAAATT